MPDTDCIFCKIIAGEIPSEIIYQDDEVMAFKDVQPVAPHHYLIVPKEHVATVNDADETNQKTLGRLFVAAGKIATELGFAEDGYRCIVNCNKHAGQVVFHLHMHLMAGKQMGWKPIG